MTGRETDPSSLTVEFTPSEVTSLTLYAWELDAARLDAATVRLLLKRKLQETEVVEPSPSVDLITSGLSIGAAPGWEEGMGWADRFSRNPLLNQEEDGRLRSFAGIMLDATIVKRFGQDIKFEAVQFPMNAALAEYHRSGADASKLELGMLSILAGGCSDGIPLLTQKIEQYMTV